LALYFSTALARMVTDRAVMVKPRKLKPSRNLVILVFSALRVRPM